MELLRNQKGSLSLEYVALLPLVVLVIIFLVQGAIAAYSLVVASATARDAARYYSVGHTAEEVEKIVSNELAGIPLKSLNCSKNDDEIEINLEVGIPVFDLPIFKDMNLELAPIKVVMPNTEDLS